MLAIECSQPMPPVMLPAKLYSSCGQRTQAGFQIRRHVANSEGRI